MRRFLLISVMMLALSAGVFTRSAWAASVVPPVTGPAIVAQQQIPDHDDSRVGVQLVVVAIAAGFVVGVGSLAFLIRWKLGRTAYDRAAAEAALGHH